MQAARTRLRAWPDNALLVVMLTLGVAGAGVAGYLTYTHYNQDALVCTVGSCETVQQSEYSTVYGVPVAVLGLGMYLTVVAITLARLTGRSPIAADLATFATWAILLAGLVYAGYLTYVELWIIDAICQWCVVSAVITALMFALQSVLVWEELRNEQD